MRRYAELEFRGSAGVQKRLKLPALSIAVVAEEAMYAPLPDGWQKAQDEEGRIYYYNRWLAGRAPSYDHPLDDSYHKLCLLLQVSSERQPFLVLPLPFCQRLMPFCSRCCSGSRSG